MDPKEGNTLIPGNEQQKGYVYVVREEGFGAFEGAKGTKEMHTIEDPPKKPSYNEQRPVQQQPTAGNTTMC